MPELTDRKAGTGPVAFLVYSNLFIAACAVLMIWQTCRLLLHASPGIDFTGFAFCATVCSYSFHWWLTPDMESPSERLHWLKKNRTVHLVLGIAGLAGAAGFGFLLRDHWPWLLLAAFITFLYSAPKIPHPWFTLLRRVALGKTIFLAFVWMYVTTLLPLQVSGQPWRGDFFLFAASRFFLIYAICILFDYRDREYDRSIGIRSLVTWLNEKGILALFILSLLAFAGFTAAMSLYGYSITIIGILLAPGIVIAALYRPATGKWAGSDRIYYLLLDGLMAFSAVLQLITGNYTF